MPRQHPVPAPLASALVLALGIAVAAPPARADDGQPFFGAMQVADAALGEMRGGFDAGAGMTIRFGIDMAATLNGLPMTQLSASGTGVATQLLPAGTSLATVDPATVVNTVALDNGLLTVVHNTQSNVAITATRTINIDISGISNAVRQQLASSALSRAIRFSVR